MSYTIHLNCAEKMSKKIDLENGTTTTEAKNFCDPKMFEKPELRWSFIRKVYSIITIQLLLTIAVALVFVFVPPIAPFVVSTTPGLVLYTLLLLLFLTSLRLLDYYHQKHPLNYFLLLIFTITTAFPVGLDCYFVNDAGKVIIESVILTTAVVFSLTLYSFWAARRGHNFSFLGPFLFGTLSVLIFFCLIQILFPLGKLSHMIFGCVESIIFCGYIVYDTGYLIKRFSYDKFISASVYLYLVGILAVRCGWVLCLLFFRPSK